MAAHGSGSGGGTGSSYNGSGGIKGRAAVAGYGGSGCWLRWQRLLVTVATLSWLLAMAPVAANEGSGG